MFELDYRPKRFNLLNVLGAARRGLSRAAARGGAARARPAAAAAPKSIHDLVAVKSSRGSRSCSRYDRHRALGFVDHFLAAGTTLEALARRELRRGAATSAGARYERRRSRARRRPRARACNCAGAGASAGARSPSTRRCTLEGRAARARGVSHQRPRATPAPLMFASESSLTLLAATRPIATTASPAASSRTDERKLAVDGRAAGEARRWSWSTSRTSSACACVRRRPARRVWRHPARDRVAVGRRLRAHLPGLGDRAGLARRRRRRRPAVRVRGHDRDRVSDL